MKFKRKFKCGDIRISASNNGCYVAQVGCATMTYGDVDSLIADLKEFLNDPKKVTQEYNRAAGVMEVATNQYDQPDQPREV